MSGLEARDRVRVGLRFGLGLLKFKVIAIVKLKVMVMVKLRVMVRSMLKEKVMVKARSWDRG